MIEPRDCDDPYWREQGKVWVEISPGRKRLVDMNKPRPTPVAKSDFPCPAIHTGAFSTPLQSMADGKFYDNKHALYKTYKAENNPQGVDYEVVGDKEIEPYSPPSKTREQNEDTDRAIARALDDIGI